MKTYVIGIFILTSWVRCAGQTNQSVQPRIVDTADELRFENFPAWSPKHRAILIAHEAYSCCVYNDPVLLVLDSHTMAIKRSFNISNAEQSLDFENKRRAILKEIYNLILDGEYESMNLIDLEDYYISYSTASENYSFNVTHMRAGPTQKKIKFEVPAIYGRSYCCTGGIQSADSCKIQFNRFQLWRHNSGKISMLSYGFTSEMNGCDVGPKYVVVQQK